MILRAFVSGRVEGVSVVPISVGYERIIEASSHRREVLGGTKRPESLGELLKTPKVLTSRYGRLYVQFGEPIDLGGYLERYGVDRLRPPDASELEALTVRLGHRIIHDINRVTSVTPTALAATVLLNATAPSVAHERLLQEVGFLLRFLREPERDARLSSALERAVAPVLDEALELLARDEDIEVLREGQERFYQIRREARPQLAYYRNNIVHLFVPEALLSAAALCPGVARMPYAALRWETHYLSRLFKYEWIYEERAEFENVFHRTLRYFERTGWLHIEGQLGQDDAVIALTDEPPVEMEYLRRLILPFLEAYAIMAEAILAIQSEGRPPRRARRRGPRARPGGGLARRDPALRDALEADDGQRAAPVRDWEIIERVEQGKDPALRVREPWRGDRRLTILGEHLRALVRRGASGEAPTLGPGR